MKRPAYVHSTPSWRTTKIVIAQMMDCNPETTTRLKLDNYATVVTSDTMRDAVGEFLKHRSLKDHLFFQIIDRVGCLGVLVGHRRSNGALGWIGLPHTRRLTLKSEYINRNRRDSVTGRCDTYSTLNPKAMAGFIATLPVLTDKDVVEAAVSVMAEHGSVRLNKPELGRVSLWDAETFYKNTAEHLDALVQAAEDNTPTPKEAVTAAKEALQEMKFYEKQQQYRDAVAENERRKNKDLLFVGRLPRWYNSHMFAVSNHDASEVKFFNTKINEFPEELLAVISTLEVSGEADTGVAGVGVARLYPSKNRDETTSFDMAMLLVSPETMKAVFAKAEPLL